MFVDQKAEGEPYLPEIPEHLPWRYPLSICLSLSVALFCFNEWLDHAMLREADTAELWCNFGDLAVALAAAIGLTAWIHAIKLGTLKIGPPF